MAEGTNKSNLTFYVIGGVILAAVIGLFIWKRKQNSPAVDSGTKEFKFDLPTTHDPAVFGPQYWKAFHALADNVPCPACQVYAVKFMKFFHDFVNLKTGKPLYDANNFNEMSDLIAQIKSNGNKWPASISSSGH